MQKTNIKDKNNVYNNSCIFKAIFILPIFVVLVCSMCLIDNTWSYFTDRQSATTPNIVAASCEIEATVNGDMGEVTLNNGKYSLLEGENYSVTLTAKGSTSTGYCVIILNDEKIHTEQFIAVGDDKKTVIKFNLDVCKNAEMQIVACWGRSTKLDEEKIKDGSVYVYG